MPKSLRRESAPRLLTLFWNALRRTLLLDVNNADIDRALRQPRDPWAPQWSDTAEFSSRPYADECDGRAVTPIGAVD